MSDASLCNVSAGGAKLFRSGAKLTNEVSGALILAMPMGDRRRRICELQKAQRPTKLLVPGFASGTHSYDNLIKAGMSASKCHRNRDVSLQRNNYKMSVHK